MVPVYWGTLYLLLFHFDSYVHDDDYTRIPITIYHYAMNLFSLLVVRQAEWEGGCMTSNPQQIGFIFLHFYTLFDYHRK